MIDTNCESPEIRGLWTFLQDVVLGLGSEGTSSDESDFEGEGPNKTPIRRVKVQPWRRKLEGHWSFIDQARKQHFKDVQDHRGAAPVPVRRAPNNPRTRRDVPSNLPKVLYDPHWISNDYGEGRFQSILQQEPKHDFTWRDIAFS